MEVNKIINLNEWSRKELGDDIVNETLNNAYLNIGVGQDILKYAFDHVYHPKFVELVKLNLATDATHVTLKNDRLLNLKKKKQELLERKAKLKSEIEAEENCTQSLINEMYSIELNRNSNEIDMKSIEYQLQSEYLNETKHLQSVFDQANRRLSSLMDSSDEIKTSKKSVERVLLQMQNKFKGKQDKTFENEDALNETLKKLDLKNTIEILNEINVEETDRIKEHMANCNIDNEIQMLKYMDSTNEHKTLKDTLNEVNVEIIQKQCEIISMKKAESVCNQKIANAFDRLQAKLGNEICTDERVLLFLGEWLQLKRTEINYEQYELYSRIMDNDLQEESRKEVHTKARLEKIKQMYLIMEKNKDIIQNIFESNKSSCERISNLQCDLDESIQTIPELLRSFEVNTSVVDESYFLNDYEKFKLKFKHLNEFIQNISLSKISEELKDLKKLIQFKEYKSMEQFLNEILGFADSILTKTNVTHEFYNTTSLKNSLNKCVSFDNEQMKPLSTKINNQIDKLIDIKKNFNEYKQILSVMINQPCAYKCLFKERTVNGKTLDYYLNLIEQNLLLNK